MAHAEAFGRRGMRDDTRNWIATAEYDLETARHLFDAERYIHVVFFCHLALEKLLKAHVTEVTKTEPAKTHSLMYLVRKAGLSPTREMAGFLGDISNESVPTRYPDGAGELLTEYTREVAENCLRSTREAMKWLREHPNLKE